MSTVKGPLKLKGLIYTVPVHKPRPRSNEKAQYLRFPELGGGTYQRGYKAELGLKRKFQA